MCGICVAWSTLWRILCCPIQCVGHGPSFMLSNNGCTDATDSCVKQYVAEVNTKATLCKLSDVLSRPSTPEERQEFIHVLTSLKKAFTDNTMVYTIAHYQLCTKIVTSLAGTAVLPAEAVGSIDAMIVLLSA